MRTFLLICVTATLLLEDNGARLHAFEPRQAVEIKAVSLEITLDEAIERVRQRHPDLKLQELALERASEEIRLATREFFPDLDLDTIASSAVGGWGLIVTAARILRPLFSLRSLLAERKIKRLLREKETVETRLRELEVAQSAKELYAALLIQEKLAWVLNQNAGLAARKWKLKEAQYKEGRLTRGELLAERLAFRKALSEARKARLLFKRSELAFRDLLDLPGVAPLHLRVPEFNESSFRFSLEECFLLAGEKNPLIESLRLSEEASLKELGKEDPILSTGGFFAGLGESGGGLFQWRPRIGAVGSFTLYDWGKKKIRRRLKNLGHNALLLNHHKALHALRDAIVKDYSELLTLESEAKTARAGFHLARESARNARLLERAGRKPFEHVLENEERYYLQAAELFKKRLEYFTTRERLLKDLGLSSLAELREVNLL